MPPDRPSNMLSVLVEGVRVDALIDTGASISVISMELCARLRKVRTPYSGPSLYGANSSMIKPSGQCTVRISTGQLRHHVQCAVLSPCAHHLILGWDFLSSASAVISCQQPEIEIADTEDSRIPEEEPQLNLTANADYVLSPGHETILSVHSTQIRDGDALIVPSARFIPRGVVIPTCFVRFARGAAPLLATNTTSEPILLPEGTTVASVVAGEGLSLVPLRSVSPVPQSSNSGPSLATLAATISEDLTAIETKLLLELLERHKNSFDCISTKLGQTSLAAHRIETDGTHIVRRRPYRVSSSERKVIQENVADMLQRNVIRPSSSPWSSPVVLVRKKDGSVRFCVDYRALNKITRKDVYPMPRIDDALDCLQGAEYFSSLDLRSGYWQIPMHESDKEKTAFATPDGLYEFNVMPFGLCNAPATFERMIDTVLHGLKWKTCLCYLDDIVIFSSSFAEHLRRLDEVLTCLANAGLTLNTKKCHFARKSIKVLGHVVSKDGIRPDPDKISAVANFPRPEQQKALRSFLGLASYFRRFVRNFATLALPLNQLLNSGTPFVWSDACEKAFEDLKQALTSAPVLCHFDDTRPAILHTDASGHGIGAVLLQRDAKHRERVVAYASRSLTRAEKNYTITEQECLAVVWSVQKFRPYLYGRHFTVVTDHHALCWLSSLKNLSGRLGRWILRLQEYDFTVTYKSGLKHLDADALSRCPLVPSSDDVASPSHAPSLPVAPVTYATADDRRELIDHQRADSYCRKIMDRLAGSTRPPNSRLRRQLRQFQLLDGALYRTNHHPNGVKWVPVVPRTLRHRILQAFHDDATAGHLGFQKTYDRVRGHFFWPGLSTSVAKYVASCAPCQHRKRSTSAPAGLLQPVPCPATPFEVVGIDLYGPLPTTATGNRWIVTAVDHLTRYAETAPLHSASAGDVADFFLRNILLRHGAPRVLLSDRGKTFLSQVLAEVLRACNTSHKLTSSYHPQTNGLTERFHRTLSDMISMYIQPDHSNWDTLLPSVTFAYNTAVQSTTGYPPFYLVYGRHPSHVLDTCFFTAPVSASASFPDEFVSRINHCRQLARMRTEASQQDRKQRYDAAHRSVSFRPGEEVLVWTPVRSPGLCEKFLHRYLGPYKVLEATSPVNYRVTPVCGSSDRRHRGTEIVHVSRLKAFNRRDPH